MATQGKTCMLSSSTVAYILAFIFISVSISVGVLTVYFTTPKEHGMCYTYYFSLHFSQQKTTLLSQAKDLKFLLQNLIHHYINELKMWV